VNACGSSTAPPRCTDTTRCMPCALRGRLVGGMVGGFSVANFAFLLLVAKTLTAPSPLFLCVSSQSSTRDLSLSALPSLPHRSRRAPGMSAPSTTSARCCGEKLAASPCCPPRLTGENAVSPKADACCASKSATFVDSTVQPSEAIPATCSGKVPAVALGATCCAPKTSAATTKMAAGCCASDEPAAAEAGPACASMGTGIQANPAGGCCASKGTSNTGNKLPAAAGCCSECDPLRAGACCQSDCCSVACCVALLMHSVPSQIAAGVVSVLNELNDPKMHSMPVHDKSLTVSGVAEHAILISSDADNSKTVAVQLASSSDTTRTARMQVLGLTCADCSLLAETKLLATPGILAATISCMTFEGCVEYDPKVASIDVIIAVINDAGFRGSLLKDQFTAEFKTAGNRNHLTATLVIFPPAGGATMLSDADVEVVRATLDGTPGVVSSNPLQRVAIPLPEEHPPLPGVLAVVWPGSADARKSGHNARLVNALEVALTYDAEHTGPRDLVALFQALGFCAHVLTSRELSDRMASHDLSGTWRWRVILGVVLVIPVIFIAFLVPAGAFGHTAQDRFDSQVVPGREGLTVSALTMFLLTTPIQWIVGWPLFGSAFRAAWFARTVNIDTLVVISTGVAYFYSIAIVVAKLAGAHLADHDFFEAPALLIVLIVIGRWLEAISKGKASESVRKLAFMQATSAVWLPNFRSNQDDGCASSADSRLALVVDGETSLRVSSDASFETEIDLSLVHRGDFIKVLPGAKVPTDGVVVGGASFVDEASLTGESVPAAKRDGDVVYGGTSNASGVLYVRVTRAASENMLASIAALVKAAQSSKPQAQQFADRLAARFVPTILILSTVVFLIWLGLALGNAIELPSNMSSLTFALQFALATLVVSCPCAIGLAVPTAIMVATGVGAKFGILFKGGIELERTHKLQVIVFDKTGTLTRGQPNVTRSMLLPRRSHANASGAGAWSAVFGVPFPASAANAVTFHLDECKDSIAADAKSGTNGLTPALSPSDDSFDDIYGDDKAHVVVRSAAPLPPPTRAATSEEATFWRLVGSAETGSEHPLGAAIVAHAREQLLRSAPGVSLEMPADFVSVVGSGVRCRIGEYVVAVGKRSFVTASASCADDDCCKPAAGAAAVPATTFASRCSSNKQEVVGSACTGVNASDAVVDAESCCKSKMIAAEALAKVDSCCSGKAAASADGCSSKKQQAAGEARNEQKEPVERGKVNCSAQTAASLACASSDAVGGCDSCCKPELIVAEVPKQVASCCSDTAVAAISTCTSKEQHAASGACSKQKDSVVRGDVVHSVQSMTDSAGSSSGAAGGRDSCFQSKPLAAETPAAVDSCCSGKTAVRTGGCSRSKAESSNQANISAAGESTEVVLHLRASSSGALGEASDVPSASLQQFAEKLESLGHTVVYASIDGELAGLIGISDPPREDAVHVINALTERGIEVWMMSGDQPRTARAVGAQLGIAPERILGGLLPGEKASEVVRLQANGTRLVAMVGDGINDAPALTQADVGIGMASGTDIAMESSDVVLVKSQLRDVLIAIDLSKATFARIRLNFAWAFMYNVVSITFAAGTFWAAGHISIPPAFAGLSELLSSIPVVGFSLLLRYYKPPVMDVPLCTGAR
jgi:cation transport ATPase